MAGPTPTPGASGGDIAALINAGINLTSGTPGTAVPTQTDSTTETFGFSSLQELLRQLTTLQESVNQSTNQQSTQNQQQNTTGTTTTQNLSDEQMAALNKAIAGIQQNMGEASPFTTAEAQAASKQASDAAVNQVVRSGIGNVANQGTSFGAYGSTVQAEQAAQLGARAAEAGAAQSLQTIQNFAQLDLQRQSQLADQLNQLLGTAVSSGGTTTQDQATTLTGKETTTGTTTTDRTQTEDTTQDRTASEESGGNSTTNTSNEYDEIGGSQSPLSSLEDFARRTTPTGIIASGLGF